MTNVITLTDVDCAGKRKARGAFYTPHEIARFLTDWAIRTKDDKVLEPSCGEAAFLLPATVRLQTLGANGLFIGEQLHGIDIHQASVDAASKVLQAQGVVPDLRTGDFFAFDPEPVYDAVIGNPPYVRYQNFAGASRARALEAALRQGVRLNQLASSWAAFTVHAAACVRPHGRLGLVLPAELLSVKYAAQVRRFLLQRFSSVRLVLFEDLIFPGVLEEVVLLLAEGSGSARSFEVYQAKNLEDLGRPQSWTDFRPREDQKWTSALLTNEAHALYDEVAAGTGFERLADWGETYLGAVTGNNDFFTLTKADAGRLRLSQSELLRISPPGSKHLRGFTFSDHAWERLAEQGERCYLFAPGENPSAASRSYIRHGESEGVQGAYKCKVRSPWWRVPLVERPDLLFTYMNHDRPRIVLNSANAHLLNSLYGVKLKASRRKLGKELLPLASLNSLTLLGSELVGRSYGGGLLKHEPTEADRLPLPSPSTLESVSDRLKLLQPQVGSLLRGRDITPALDIVDRLLLQETLGLTAEQVVSLRASWAFLARRRTSRARGTNGQN
ncbi:MAG: class I SAM-dependent methyltransferase [Burkholderiaceae bacterium]|nr:class I SAM-dependent methyltransferase [Burkholderiaceae bacterium]